MLHDYSDCLLIVVSLSHTYSYSNWPFLACLTLLLLPSSLCKLIYLFICVAKIITLNGQWLLGETVHNVWARFLISDLIIMFVNLGAAITAETGSVGDYERGMAASDSV